MQIGQAPHLAPRKTVANVDIAGQLHDEIDGAGAFGYFTKKRLVRFQVIDHFLDVGGEQAISINVKPVTPRADLVRARQNGAGGRGADSARHRGEIWREPTSFRQAARIHGGMFDQQTNRVSQIAVILVSNGSVTIDLCPFLAVREVFPNLSNPRRARGWSNCRPGALPKSRPPAKF